MPRPKTGETKNDFIKRCIPIVLDDGTAKDGEQAVAVCNSMWERRGKEVERMEDEQKECGVVDKKMLTLATTFEELEAEEQAGEALHEVGELVGKFSALASNTLTMPEVDDKPGALQKLADGFVQRVKSLFGGGAANDEMKEAPMKTEDGVKRPASAYAYVPDKEKPSTWKLPLTDANGKVTRDKLGNAAAAFSSGGFRGEKVDIPSADVAAVKRRIRSEYEKLGVQRADIPASVKESAFLLWKEESGRYRWLAIYSNKYRDQDNPPEILSEAAHQRFVKEIDDGAVPMPELWMWHVPGSRWGQADWVSYASEGFAMASGLVDNGHEKEAEAIAAMYPPPLTSHGMPRNLIERDEKDNSVITRYVTKEISVLPAWAAANKLTSFDVEVKQMSLPDEKKEFLRAAGYSDEKITELEAALADKSKAASDAGLEYKEEGQEVAADAAKEEQQGVAVIKSDQFATREEVAQEFAKLVTGLTALGESVQALTKEVHSLKESDEDKVAKAAAGVPVASLEALIMRSVIGRAETQIDGRSTLAKSKPKEAETEPTQYTGIPFIDKLLSTDAQRQS